MRRHGVAAMMRTAALALALVAMAASAVAAEGDKTYVMKLSTATINDSQHEWMKMFVAAVEKDSGGRIKGEIYPASQLGSIPRQIEGTQFGAIQGWIGPPEFLSGIDERFEVLTAPGLFTSMPHLVKTLADPALHKMVLGFGADKGLVGVGLFISAPSSIITRKPVRHLGEFKGLKLRVLASQFQNEQISRLGATPVAMSLGDVLPAIQQGAIDGAMAAVQVYTTMQFQDAAKYITETGTYYITSVAELSKKWFDALPPDLQQIIRTDAATAEQAVDPWEIAFYESQRKVWVAKGGELIELPPTEQSAMMESLVSIGDDLTNNKPALKQAYDTLVAAVNRSK
jgi:TRAP-type transport system periplasmic protein